MMNLTRRAPFTLEISFDCSVNELEDFILSVRQNGKSVLTKSKRDALVDDSNYSASIVLSGEETALLQPSDPAWIQVSATLLNGEGQHSAAYELNVVDVLDAQEEKKWR